MEKNVYNCPICKKEVMSDVELHEFCGLCGMGIIEPLKSPKIQDDNGKIRYFCCDQCYHIYRMGILHDIENASLMDLMKKNEEASLDH